WGMSQSGSTHLAPGSGSGKVNVQDLSFTKHIDDSTPNLIQFCCNGAHFKQALLTVRKAGGKEQVEYLKIALKDLIVSAISTGGSGGDDRITENVTLNFGKFEVTYTPQTATGSAGASKAATWNIPSNTDKIG
ncbi:MAG TPA: type VI secretion system tube protein Hcp, partial [Polyangia bacterium]|nr:type VI secretion system tube protein Hcp [Polyangia bacterium]